MNMGTARYDDRRTAGGPATGRNVAAPDDPGTALSRYTPDKYQVIARPEDLEIASPLIRADVTVVRIDPRGVRQGGDCHDLGAGQLLPDGSAVDRIGEAAGVSFVESGCSTRREGSACWIGRATATRLQPDGTRRSVTAEYEWDADVRAEEVRLRNEALPPSRRKSEIDIAREVLQFRKFGRARADTGARLRAIRKLIGIPTSFTAAQLRRPLVLVRIQIDAQAMLADPVLRDALVAQTVGAAGSLYGPGAAEARDVPPALPAPAPAAALTEHADAPDAAPPDAALPDAASPDAGHDQLDANAADSDPRFEQAREQLSGYLHDGLPLPAGAGAEIAAAVSDERTPLAKLWQMQERLRTYRVRASRRGGAS